MKQKLSPLTSVGALPLVLEGAAFLSGVLSSAAGAGKEPQSHLAPSGYFKQWESGSCSLHCPELTELSWQSPLPPSLLFAIQLRQSLGWSKIINLSLFPFPLLHCCWWGKESTGAFRLPDDWHCTQCCKWPFIGLWIPACSRFQRLWLVFGSSGRCELACTVCY